MSRFPKRTALLAAARERILVLDGAMGTMIQGLEYDEAAFRGERFKDFHRDLRGNNDLLILTQPKAIEDIHAEYLRAGADIVATNTFSSTSIAQADYDLSGLAYELNLEGAKLAREPPTRVAAEDGKPRFVAGALGPTNRTASISPDVSNPGYRAVTFDDLRRPMASRSTACWTAAPICCWSRPSSTPSTPRRRSTPSPKSRKRAASTCP